MTLYERIDKEAAVEWFLKWKTEVEELTSQKNARTAKTISSQLIRPSTFALTHKRDTTSRLEI